MAIGILQRKLANEKTQEKPKTPSKVEIMAKSAPQHPHSQTRNECGLSRDNIWLPTKSTEVEQAQFLLDFSIMYFSKLAIKV